MESSLQQVWPFLKGLSGCLVKAGSEGKTEVEGGKDGRWLAGNKEGGRQGGGEGGEREGRGGREEGEREAGRGRLGPPWQQGIEDKWERLEGGANLHDGCLAQGRMNILGTPP